jgi:hypothetical protein
MKLTIHNHNSSSRDFKSTARYSLLIGEKRIINIIDYLNYVSIWKR